MSASVLRMVMPSRQCRDCPTLIPADRERCYFHARPRAPRSLPETRLEHLASHLRDQDKAYLPLLIEPLTLDEIAAQMGPGWTRRHVESAWYAIRLRLGMDEGAGKAPLERLRILRIVSGMDPCVCGR